VDSRRRPYAPAVHGDGAGAERGSTLPFVLVCWLVAALMVFGGIAASDAFLEQQEVQSVCDGAALAAANRTDEAIVYTSGVGTELPLTRAAAQAAVADQLADGGTRLDAWSAETDGTEVTVRCTRNVDIAFGWLFLGGEPLERTATASARAPTL
jgi:Flp pilus assembly protein TadG